MFRKNKLIILYSIFLKPQNKYFLLSLSYSLSYCRKNMSCSHWVIEV